VLIFACYLTIGLQLAVVPRFVHLQLGFNAVVAGLAISAQYVATLARRPFAGRMGDTIGAKRTARFGLFACGLSGLIFVVAVVIQNKPPASLSLLLMSRLVLGFGESWVATGSTLWGIVRLGRGSEAKVISWSGIGSFGGIAAGASLGVWLENHSGIGAIGITSAAVAVTAFLWAAGIPAVAVGAGRILAFRKVLGRVLADGLGLALGGIGFGTIAAFVSLYYANRNWTNAGLSLTLFGGSFVAARLLLSWTVNKWGGYPVAIASLAVECAGLIVLYLASTPEIAHAGAALAGFGFSLVFPALGVEAVGKVPLESRGSALGMYTAFVDLSLGVSGPVAGVVVKEAGYPSIFLFAAAMAGLSVALLVVLHFRAARDSARVRVETTETHVSAHLHLGGCTKSGGNHA